MAEPPAKKQKTEDISEEDLKNVVNELELGLRDIGSIASLPQEISETQLDSVFHQLEDGLKGTFLEEFFQASFAGAPQDAQAEAAKKEEEEKKRKEDEELAKKKEDEELAKRKAEEEAKAAAQQAAKDAQAKQLLDEEKRREKEAAEAAEKAKKEEEEKKRKEDEELAKKRKADEEARVAAEQALKEKDVASLLQDLDDLDASMDSCKSAMGKIVEAIFSKFDTDKNGVIEGDEYTVCVKGLLAYMKKEFEREIKKAIDRSGCTANKEAVFKNFMESKFDEAGMRRQIVQMVDPDGDERITKDEALIGFKKVVDTVEEDDR